jgi:hypothetical protein
LLGAIRAQHEAFIIPTTGVAMHWIDPRYLPETRGDASDI